MTQPPHYMSPGDEALISRSQRAETISTEMRKRTLDRLRDDEDEIVEDPLDALIEHAGSGS